MNIPKEELEVEQIIQEKGLTRPRVTPERINEVIRSEEFTVVGTTTICVLHLANGFTVTGESACVDPSNFNIEIGQQIARNNARRKIWALEGYLLQQQYSELVGDDGANKALIPFCMDILTNAMKQDNSLAWSWQCNIAMAAFDAGVDHRTANISAASFLRRLFDIDVTTFPEYQAFEKEWSKKTVSFDGEEHIIFDKSLPYEQICDLCNVDWELDPIITYDDMGKIGSVKRGESITIVDRMEFCSKYK